MRNVKLSHSIRGWGSAVLSGQRPGEQGALARRRMLVVGGAVALGGCATRRDRPALDEAETLADLRDRLEQDFAGTPVQFQWDEPARPGGARALWVSVPQPHGFDLGRAAVRPALAALLDRVAPALRRQARWSLQVQGPVDARAPAGQGGDRAAAVRDYLVMKGVPPARLRAATRSGTASTELRLFER